METGAFDSFYDDFLMLYAKRLLEILNKENSEKKITYDIDKILFILLSQLKQELIELSIKTLILEFEEWKKENAAIGLKMESYKRFNESFSFDETNLLIFDKYPVLKQLIYLKVNTTLKLVRNAIINLSKDLGEIRTTIGKELDMIVSIETNLGDSHNGGKSVLIFVDSNNNKIVYKPRELAPEKLFLHIINWINSTNFVKYELKAPKLLVKKSYGWQEFIEYKSCMSEEEVKAYFYRVGIFLALFYVTRCGDLHYENIIAHGEFPMFVDMETIMSNDLEEKNNYKESIINTFIQEINQSVLGTMLLPRNMESQIMDIDISGLTGKGGVKSNKIINYKLVNHGSDQIHLEPYYAITQKALNRVVLKNEYMEPSNYCNNIEEGFRDGYGLLKKYKCDFIKVISMPNVNQGIYRQVLRTTHVYGKFLEAAHHPRYLQTSNDRKHLIELLYQSSLKRIEENPKEEIRVKEEIKSLIQEDIPYFGCDMKSKDLYSNGRIIIKNYYQKSIFEQVKNRINGLNEKDMQKQIYYIRLSLSTIKKAPKKELQECLRESLLQNNIMIEAKDYAVAIGEYIYNKAIWTIDKKKCTWLMLTVDEENKFKQEPSDYHLYNGGGLVWFFALLGVETKINKYKDIAIAALNGLEEIWGKSVREKAGTSVFYGEMSLVYLYYNLSVLWKDTELYYKFLKHAEAVFEYKLEKNFPLDIIGGASGIIVCCLNIYEEKKEKIILEIIKKYGAFLYDKLYESINGHLTGFSHGYAGYSVALIKTGKIIAESRYIELGERLINYENQFIEDNNWSDMRKKIVGKSPVYWCHGAAGIGLARSLIVNDMKGEMQRKVFQDIERAVNEILANGMCKGENLCLCHGIMGNVDILITIFQKEKNLRTILPNLNIELSNLTNNYIQSEMLGFMLGLAGIGYVFLRLVDPQYPSLLCLEVMKRKKEEEDEDT